MSLNCFEYHQRLAMLTAGDALWALCRPASERSLIILNFATLGIGEELLDGRKTYFDCCHVKYWVDISDSETLMTMSSIMALKKRSFIFY